MSDCPVAVVHVIGPDVSAGRLAAARLIHAERLGAEHTVLLVGGGANRVRWPGAMNVRAAFDLPWLVGRSMRLALERLQGARSDRNPPILHVWSPQALRWVRPVSRAGCGLLVEVETAAAASELPADMPADTAYVCSTARVYECLAERGVSTECRWLIRDGVDCAAIENVPRAALRDNLGLRGHEIAIAVLPPLTRGAGAVYAAWAGLLLEKVRPDIRLIVPGRGDENRQLRYLVRSCRHEHAVLFAESLSVAELVAAADLAVYLPISDAPVTGLAWAMMAGRPIVASAVPPVTELLEDGRSAWLCRPRDPHDAARGMLNALEQPQVSARLAQAAGEKAAALFSPQRVLEQYGQAYAALAADGGAAHVSSTSERMIVGARTSRAEL